MKRAIPILLFAAFALSACGSSPEKAAAPKKQAVKAAKPNPWASDAPEDKAASLAAKKPAKPSKSAKAEKPATNPWALDKPEEQTAAKRKPAKR